ncbi:hypothetical protein Tco_0719401 [Tanacetum coccineum]
MIGCKMIRTLASVEFEIILILGLPCCLSSSSVRCLENADKAQNSRVPPPFPEDPYEAIRQACLVETDTESEPSEDPIDTEIPELPYDVASVSPTTLPDSTPPACHTEESKDSDTSGARSTSSDSTAPLSPDHLLTRTSPTPTPTRALFHRRTARMTVRAQPVISLGHSARVAEEMALSDLALRKRYRSSYETSSSSSPALPVRKRYRGSELILDTDSEEDEIGEEDTDDDEGHGLDDEGHGLGLKGEEDVPEGQQRAVPVVGATASTPLGLGYGALRRLELAVKEDQVYSTFEIGQGSGSDGIAYIDIPAYPPPAPPAPPAQTPPSPEWSSGLFPVSPIPSAVPSPISSPMISLTVPSPTLTATIPAGHVDTWMENMSWAGYDDHRLVHDMLVQQAALRRDLQEMRGRVTALKQERDRRER